MDKLTTKQQHEQAGDIVRVRELLGLTPGQMADAMGVPYDTLKNWTGATRKRMPAVGWRCLYFLEVTRNDCATAAEWFAEWAEALDIRSNS